jgi:GTP-binding protein
MIDTVDIVVQAGNGGDGFLAFRREKFVARGGPEGGDGGDGGSIYLLATPDENTLQHLTYKRRHRAADGTAGKRSNKHGRNGEDIVILVPVGTIVSQTFGADEGVPPIDLSEDGMKVLIARGGSGGKGNAQYVSPTNQEPLLRESGEKGDTRQLSLEVKVLADVGVIGVPNAGKSSFVTRVTAARPKIAAYPFTTLEPVLGVVENRRETFVIAEIPGLVEGAHQGIGLGHEFLRHAERTRIFLHLLDGNGIDPIDDYRKVNEELRKYSPDLATRPQIVVINKTDVEEVQERLPELISALKALNVEPLSISAATGDGIQPVLDRLLAGVNPAEDKKAPPKIKVVIDGAPVKPRTGRVLVLEDGTFSVNWSKAERLITLANTDDHLIVGQLFREFRRLGVTDALEAKGVKYGDTVQISDWEFIWGDVLSPELDEAY